MSAMQSGADNNVDEMLADAIKNIGIPPRPRLLESISAEMRRDEPDLAKLATTISADVSLSAGLMKTANSPFFGVAGRARTIQQAMMLLGLDIAARAVTGMVLRNTFPRVASLERFWDASARIAQISGWMATRLKLEPAVNPGDAYSFGLFRDCGIAVMMRRFPDYAETLGIANRSVDRSFTEIENSRHPSNHAVVGCLLARTWWLPETSCIAIRHHHDVPAIAAGTIALPQESARLIAIAQFAERILQSESGRSHTSEWEKMGPLCMQLLGLDSATETAIQAEASRMVPAVY